MDTQPSFCPRHSTYASARRFMLAALLQVEEYLPAQARYALRRAVAFQGSETDSEEETKVREGLWESITGRIHDRTPEVLCIRATICALYAFEVDPPDPNDTIEFFVNTFHAAGFSASALNKAADETSSEA